EQFMPSKVLRYMRRILNEIVARCNLLRYLKFRHETYWHSASHHWPACAAKDPHMDRRLIVLASGMFAIGTDSFVVAGVLSQVSASLGVAIALAGQMVTLYAISYALLSPVIAAAAAHWPRKRLLLTGLAVFVLGNVVTALAPNIELVLASRLLAGLGAAMFS